MPPLQILDHDMRISFGKPLARGLEPLFPYPVYEQSRHTQLAQPVADRQVGRRLRQKKCNAGDIRAFGIPA